MLDDDLLRSSGFPAEKMEVIKQVMMHGASGNEVPVVTSRLQALKIGKYELKMFPFRFWLAISP